MTEDIANNEQKSTRNEKIKKIFSFLLVIIGQIFIFFAGILTSFLLPKIFDISSYGYIKTFTLYIAYVGLAHFGFIDGLHIILSGKKYEELDKKKIRLFSLLFTIAESVFSLIVGIVMLIAFRGENQIVFLFIALTIVFNNLYGYAQQIAIVSSKFMLVSICNFIDAGFKLFTILLIWVLSKFVNVHFVVYIALYIAQYIVVGLVYVLFLRDCFFGKISFKSTNAKEIFDIFKTGIPLLLANLLVSFVSSFVSIFIQITYPVDASTTYAIYSFAISMSSIISPVVTAVGMIMFPSIRKMEYGKSISMYKTLMKVLAMLIGLLLVTYPVILLVFSKVVPNYSVAFPLFNILFPGILISAIVVVVNLNYFKLIKKLWAFNIITVSTLGAGIVVLLLLYFLHLRNIDNETALIYFAVVGLAFKIIWFLATTIYLSIKTKIICVEEIIFLIICSGLFYLTSYIHSFTTIGFLFIYGLLYIAVFMAFYCKEVFHYTPIIWRKVKSIYQRFEK